MFLVSGLPVGESNIGLPIYLPVLVAGLLGYFVSYWRGNSSSLFFLVLLGGFLLVSYLCPFAFLGRGFFVGYCCGMRFIT